MHLRYLWLLLVLLDHSGCYDGCPQSRAEFCGEKTCGGVTAENACGEVQTIDCGECSGAEFCGGGGVPNVCSACTHPEVTLDCAGGWCKIPSGCFKMGTPSDGQCVSEMASYPDANIFGAETEHEVALMHGFQIMDAELTQRIFRDQMGYNPSHNVQQPNIEMPDNPVEYVNWHQAVDYANALSTGSGLESCYDCIGSDQVVDCHVKDKYAGEQIYECPGYRLPTEAEWEYAYRAGSVTALHNGPVEYCMPDGPDASDTTLDAIAWYGSNAEDKHHLGKRKQPNAWGLYDMAGNLWEWCHDWMAKDLGAKRVIDPAGLAAENGTVKSLKGGAYEWPEPMVFRAASRRQEMPKHLCHSIGFRLAQTLHLGPSLEPTGGSQ
jgi:formylglycine-generating enzyme required for sulfatase activity